MSKRRNFSEEFKREAVELIRQPGTTISQIARDSGWVQGCWEVAARVG